MTDVSRSPASASSTDAPKGPPRAVFKDVTAQVLTKKPAAKAKAPASSAPASSSTSSSASPAPRAPTGIREVDPKAPPVDVAPQVAKDLGLPEAGVRAVIALFAEGATVPFIARYRKEKTGELDEVQIRDIGERHKARVELEARRKTVLDTIESQGKLSDDLKKKILAADTPTALEDLYLPYKPKRRTKAQIAREAGLEPLAERILAQPTEGNPSEEAAAFIDAEKGVADVTAALTMARDIVCETLVENADARAHVRKLVADHGALQSEIADSHAEQKTKFDQYREFAERLKDIPSHRFLAIKRGEKEGVLRAKVDLDKDQEERIRLELERIGGLDNRSPFADEMRTAIRTALIRLRVHTETDVVVDTKMRADEDAISIFATNLKELLLAAPLGQKAVIGVDPGLRTGCKVAVINDVGTFVEDTVVYLTSSESKQREGEAVFLALVARHKPIAIAVGNGTGNREAEAFCKKVLKQVPESERPFVVSVNEAGASVYSASDVAREEFPHLDLTVRGAISIARRLQDPLAELVKIDPKSIGVGQYQHDVNQSQLAKKLGQVVEDCVNSVGVELNTASAPLLAHVAGVGPTVAKKIVAHREKMGAFSSRDDVKKVAGVGAKTFEQAAGFLRLRDGAHPLDRSAVHPERYGVVEQMAKDLDTDVASLIGNKKVTSKIALEKYLSDDLGRPTLLDIIAELEKPGRDPRESFAPPAFRDDVTELSDLKVGMVLEGIITNVTAFGAFVDVGVHQDGLVHVSRLANHFVKDPSEVARAGQKLTVRVLEVDMDRKRISLTARLDDPADNMGGGSPSGGGGGSRNGGNRGGGNRSGGNRGGGNRGGGGGGQKQFTNNPFADLLKPKS